jgi:hypothetical protein
MYNNSVVICKAKNMVRSSFRPFSFPPIAVVYKQTEQCCFCNAECMRPSKPLLSVVCQSPLLVVAYPKRTEQFGFNMCKAKKNIYKGCSGKK